MPGVGSSVFGRVRKYVAAAPPTTTAPTPAQTYQGVPGLDFSVTFTVRVWSVCTVSSLWKGSAPSRVTSSV